MKPGSSGRNEGLKRLDEPEVAVGVTEHKEDPHRTREIAEA
jgi:hypothetical protein